MSEAPPSGSAAPPADPATATAAAVSALFQALPKLLLGDLAFQNAFAVYLLDFIVLLLYVQELGSSSYP